MIGRVVSTKMKDTVVVLVERTAKHPLYKKTFVRTKKYLVDIKEAVKEGDIVEIIKIKPISKNKHWRVTRVVGKDLVAINEEQLKAAAEEAIAEVMPEEPSESVTDKLKTGKPTSENRKLKTDNRRSKK